MRGHRLSRRSTGRGSTRSGSRSSGLPRARSGRLMVAAATMPPSATRQAVSTAIAISASRGPSTCLRGREPPDPQAASVAAQQRPGRGPALAGPITQSRVPGRAPGPVRSVSSAIRGPRPAAVRLRSARPSKPDGPGASRPDPFARTGGCSRIGSAPKPARTSRTALIAARALEGTDPPQNRDDVRIRGHCEGFAALDDPVGRYPSAVPDQRSRRVVTTPGVAAGGRERVTACAADQSGKHRVGIPMWRAQPGHVPLGPISAPRSPSATRA